MKKQILFFLIVIISLACSVSIDLTSTPPTPIPLSQVELDGMLVQPGDLPPGYSGAQIDRMTGDGMQKASQAIVQELAIDNEVKGAVLVYLYESVDELKRTFPQFDLTEFAKSREFVNIGEEGYFYITDYDDKDFNRDLDITFKRCHAIVWIRFFAAKPEVQPNNVELYAERLDERLQPLVCK